MHVRHVSTKLVPSPSHLQLAPRVPQRRAPDVFEAARRVVPAPVDGLRPWSELTPVQQRLFGAGGERVYAQLSSRQRAIFLLLVQRLERNGADLGGLRLMDPVRTIRPNRILFAPDPVGLARFEASLRRGFDVGTFSSDNVFGGFHPGMASFGARENRRKWSMQIGIGPKGAFVDVDRFNPWTGVSAWLGHFGEIVTPGKPRAEKIARELGEDLGPIRTPLRRVA
ncbi:MAG: hypothetical protein ACK4N5_01795 [Myxococcales bacterium]